MSSRGFSIVCAAVFCLCNLTSPMAHPPEKAAKGSVGTLGIAKTKADNLVIVRELHGPSKTHGIKSVKALGVVDLGVEFDSMQGYQMRARLFTIMPGGVVAYHEHQSRPGYAYILSGTIVEHRNDENAALIRKAGDLAIERTGVAHWWENTSDKPVIALVVDIFKPE